MLHALQSAFIYGLLCSQCTESVPDEDIDWLISTTEVWSELQLNVLSHDHHTYLVALLQIFARRLYSISSYDRGLDYASLSRSKWVFVESQRRYMAIA